MSEDIFGQQNERANWSLDERYQHERELAERRRLYDEEQAARKEVERVAGLRAEMEEHCRERMVEWMDHGGDPDDFKRVWPGMMKDFLDAKAIEREVSRDDSFEDIWS